MWEHPSFIFARGVGRAVGAIVLVIAFIAFLDVFSKSESAKEQSSDDTDRLAFPLAALSLGILLWGL